MSSSGYLLGTFFLIFCPCCPLRGHRWTAFSIVSDRLLSYICTNLPHLTSPLCLPIILPYQTIFSYINFVMSANTHAPFFKWLYRFLLYLLPSIHLESRSVQCTNCSLWVHLSCSGFSLAQFQKISPGHTWTCLKRLSQTSVSLSYSVSIFSTLKKNTQKNPSTINNSCDLPNHPQITSTYPPSALSLRLSNY